MRNERAELDRERVEELTEKLLGVLKEHYEKGPESRYRVFEVLNALAACAGLVIAGTKDELAREFFMRALEEQLKG